MRQKMEEMNTQLLQSQSHVQTLSRSLDETNAHMAAMKN